MLPILCFFFFLTTACKRSFEPFLCIQQSHSRIQRELKYLELKSTWPCKTSQNVVKLDSFQSMLWWRSLWSKYSEVQFYGCGIAGLVVGLELQMVNRCKFTIIICLPSKHFETWKTEYFQSSCCSKICFLNINIVHANSLQAKSNSKDTFSFESEVSSFALANPFIIQKENVAIYLFQCKIKQKNLNECWTIIKEAIALIKCGSLRSYSLRHKLCVLQ